MKALVAGLGILGLAFGCNRRIEGAATHPSRLASASGERESRVHKSNPAVELMVAPSSAYTAGLVVDTEAIYLLTDRAAHRFVPGASSQQIPLDNGATAAATRTHLVYWSKGAIWRIPKAGGEARRLALLPHQPQFFMAAGDDLAWLAMPVRDRFSIQTLDDGKVRTLLYHAGRIETATMDAGRVFFVRRENDDTWRIGSVSVRGGEPMVTTPKTGPTPAKLAVSGDVFYYDLRSNEVRRISADLSQEEALTRDVICSPIAVSATIYCPTMAGIYELTRHSGTRPVPVFPDPRRIAAVAATPRFLAWISDAGADRLSLMMMHVTTDEAN